MTITVNDIKLLESERLTDTPDGGGRMTGSVVDNNEVNNLFPDISRFDRTYGRLSLRKAYMAVQSVNTDVYLGSHVIVTDAPNDDKVNVTLFTTKSSSDVRVNAQNRIESYVTAGPKSPYYLYGTVPAGAKAIQLLGRPETALPEVGEVLVLSVEDSAGVVTSYQYVRIVQVEFEDRTFTDDQGDYVRKVVTVSLVSPLRQTFVGAEASRFSNVSPPTKIRTTLVADASRYYGLMKLSGPVAENDLQIVVNTILSQLVPSTTREIAVANAKPGSSQNFVEIGSQTSENLGSTGFFFTRGSMPKSITGTTYIGSAAVHDNGLGLLLNSANAEITTIDYESGKVGLPGGTYQYTPSVNLQRASYYQGKLIELGNQGTVYVINLQVTPAPGTVSVDYRYLGKWYTLTDRALNGTLSGLDPAHGGGTVDYQNSTVVVTLGALPDIGSMLITSAGQNQDFVIRTAGISVSQRSVDFYLADPAETTLGGTISWISGGVTRTATIAATTGVITGDGTGNLDFASGYISFIPSTSFWPDAGTNIVVDYTKAESFHGTVQGSFVGGILDLEIPVAFTPVRPGSISVRIPALLGLETKDIWVKDDGIGGATGDTVRDNSGMSEQAVDSGILDYVDGLVTVNIGSVTVHRPVFIGRLTIDKGTRYDWENLPVFPTIHPAPMVEVFASKNVAGTQAVQQIIPVPGISFNLGAAIQDSYVPGSIWFTLGGADYFDRNGKIFRSLNRVTGSAIEAGTVNYSNGLVNLTNWAAGVDGTVVVKSLLSTYGELPMSYMVFRTPGAPVRPSSVYLQGIRSDNGQLISATSGLNGEINTPNIHGFANHEMGWVEVEFGEMVTAAGNENEPWYDPDLVVGGQIFKPVPMIPSSITFSCVVLTTLPLDADLLGIDPIRLPLTGQVPIVRESDVVVISEDREHTFPSGLVAGQVITLPDNPVTQIRLVDDTDAVVPISQYSIDYVVGEVTMSTPLDLTGLTQPLRAIYRVEDMALVSGIDLSGILTLVSPLTRDYSTDAIVSSALPFGDLQAQNPVFLSQQTWTGVWSDDRIGSNTTAQYNRTLYPVELVNKDAITERWALIFTSASGGNVVGETLGQIGTFNIIADTAPINPVTGSPYFLLKKEGWGTGWATNNVLRINTIGPNAPIWIARTILPGAKSMQDDSFSIQLRGDSD